MAPEPRWAPNVNADVAHLGWYEDAVVEWPGVGTVVVGLAVVRAAVGRAVVGWAEGVRVAIVGARVGEPAAGGVVSIVRLDDVAVVSVAVEREPPPALFVHEPRPNATTISRAPA